MSHVGDGYIYGAKGQVCSFAFRTQQATQYPQYNDMIMNTGQKWDGKQVWDCAQFTRAALKNAGVSLVSGATSQYRSDAWTEKGTIDKMPSECVCCVFRESDGRMQHTGLYIGDGTVVHSQGTKTGVIHQKLSDYPWTHYAIPKTAEVMPMEVQYNARVKAETGTTVNMRESASKESSRVCAVPIGQIVDVYEDGNQWLQIGWNGKTGYMMRKYLEAVTESEKQETALPLYEWIAQIDERLKRIE